MGRGEVVGWEFSRPRGPCQTAASGGVDSGVGFGLAQGRGRGDILTAAATAGAGRGPYAAMIPTRTADAPWIGAAPPVRNAAGRAHPRGGWICRVPARFAPVALVLLLLGIGVAFAGQPGPLQRAEPIHLVVLHTNDVHGQALPRRATWIRDREQYVGGLSRVAAYVEQVRREHKGPRRGVLLVDGGDWFQGTPEGQIQGGKPFLKAMLALGYDGLAVGNHEWDLGEAGLRALLEIAGERALCANVRLGPGGERVDFFHPYRVVSVAGLDVALVGFVARETPFITHRDARRYHFSDPAAEMEQLLQELPKGVDLVLPLSHCGVDADRALAQAFPELPLIVGGHSHTFLREAVRVDATRIVQAGSKATVVGRVDLYIDPRTKRVLEMTSRLVELEAEPEPEQRVERVERLVAELTELAAAAMEDVVGEMLATPHPGGPLRSSGLGNWIADSMRAAFDADVALHNKGGIRAALVEGPITRRNLFEVMPFDNTAVAFWLSGAELETVVKRGLEGTGRRGFECSGMTVEVSDGPDGVRVQGILVGGRALDPKVRYRMATNSFLASGGDRLFELGRPLEIEDSGRLLRDLLEADLVAQPRFTVPNEDRYQRRQAPQ